MKRINACRLCKSEDLVDLFSLGDQYVSDFVGEKIPRLGEGYPQRVPIEIVLCRGCTLVQQRYSADIPIQYWYRSGVTETMRKALRDVTEAVEKRVDLKPGDVVLDIGSNDGTLLRSYSVPGLFRVGVEPAKNVATQENYEGLYLIHDFWSYESYEQFWLETYRGGKEKDQQEQRPVLVEEEGFEAWDKAFTKDKGQDTGLASRQEDNLGEKDKENNPCQKVKAYRKDEKEDVSKPEVSSGKAGTEGKTSGVMDGGEEPKMVRGKVKRRGQIEEDLAVQGMEKESIRKGQLQVRNVQESKELACGSYQGVQSISEAEDQSIQWKNTLQPVSLQTRLEVERICLEKTKVPKAKIVCAIGMFYDLEEPNKFVADIAKVLAPDGLFIAQLMCLRNTLNMRDVGNYCHEHLEFYSLKSLVKLFGDHGLEIVDIETNQVNGESYRLYVKHKGGKLLDVAGAQRVIKAMRQEVLLDDPAFYGSLYEEWRRNKQRCMSFIKDAVAVGKKVWIYGASTKGNVLLQFYGLDSSLITAAAERSPEKHGLHTVGTGIPIVSEEAFRQAAPDYALVLPYCFLEEFKARESEWLSKGGRFLVALPEFKVVGGK